MTPQSALPSRLTSLPHRAGTMVRDQGLLTSVSVSRLARVSLRQLQWWDERALICPIQVDHRRLYGPDQVSNVLLIAAMRRKRISLQRARKILRLMVKERVRPAFVIAAERVVRFADTEAGAFAKMIAMNEPCVLLRVEQAWEAMGSHAR